MASIGFVVVLSTNVGPNPDRLLREMGEDADKNGGHTYLLARMHINPEGFRPRDSVVGLLGDATTKRLVLATGRFVRVFPPTALGTPNHPRLNDLVPCFQAELEDIDVFHPTIVELTQFKLCEPQASLRELALKPLGAETFDPPENPGVSFFHVIRE